MNLLIPFHYEYMVKAIWVSALIGRVCGLLSCFITLKGWSLMGDALSHAVVPRSGGGGAPGARLPPGPFVAGLLAAGGMGFIKSRTPLREDAGHRNCIHHLLRRRAVPHFAAAEQCQPADHRVWQSPGNLRRRHSPTCWASRSSRWGFLPFSGRTLSCSALIGKPRRSG